MKAVYGLFREFDAPDKNQGDKRGDGTQQGNCRELPKRHDFVAGDNKGRKITNINPADNGADYRGNHDRRKGLCCERPDHHLKGEEHAGDGRIKGGSDARRDTTGNQGQVIFGGQPHELSKLAGDKGAKMNDGPFTSA